MRIFDDDKHCVGTSPEDLGASALGAAEEHCVDASAEEDSDGLRRRFGFRRAPLPAARQPHAHYRIGTEFMRFTHIPARALHEGDDRIVQRTRQRCTRNKGAQQHTKSG